MSNRVTYVHGDRLAGWLDKCRREVSPSALMSAENLAKVVEGINRSRPREARSRWQRLRVRTGLRRNPVAGTSTAAHGS
jgi:hypothetical protein